MWDAKAKARSNYIMGIESKQKGDLAAAAKFYLKAIEHYPAEDAFHLNETYNNLGTVYYELGQHLEAKQAWEKALVYLPSDKITRANLVEFIYGNTALPEDIRSQGPFMKKHWGR